MGCTSSTEATGDLPCEPGPKQISIYITCTDGERFPVQVPARGCVGDLKRAIATVRAVEPGVQVELYATGNENKLENLKRLDSIIFSTLLMLQREGETAPQDC
jgi:hypothetical protein